MKPGTVIFHKKFKVSDYREKDKLFVLLNYQRAGKLLALMTTSQQNNREKKEGCHADKGYFFSPKERVNSNWFDTDTWILLYHAYEFTRQSLEKAEQRGDVVIMTDLNEQFTRAIINCFMKSDDCSDYHLWLLE